MPPATPRPQRHAVAPKLMYERLEELGLDYAVVYSDSRVVTISRLFEDVEYVTHLQRAEYQEGRNTGRRVFGRWTPTDVAGFR